MRLGRRMTAASWLISSYAPGLATSGLGVLLVNHDHHDTGWVSSFFGEAVVPFCAVSCEVKEDRCVTGADKTDLSVSGDAGGSDSSGIAISEADSDGVLDGGTDSDGVLDGWGDSDGVSDGTADPSEAESAEGSGTDKGDPILVRSNCLHTTWKLEITFLDPDVKLAKRRRNKPLRFWEEERKKNEREHCIDGVQILDIEFVQNKPINFTKIYQFPPRSFNHTFEWCIVHD